MTKKKLIRFINKPKLARDLKPFDVVVGFKAYGNYQTERIVLAESKNESGYIQFVFYNPKDDIVFRYSYHSTEWLVIR